MYQQGIRPTWPRVVGIMAASTSLLYLLGVLFVGYFVMTTDWSVLGCWDNPDPSCDDPERGALGLSAVRTSSWLLGAAAVAASAGALVLALRLRRTAHLAPVLLLCATSALVAQLLLSRLF